MSARPQIPLVPPKAPRHMRGGEERNVTKSDIFPIRTSSALQMSLTQFRSALNECQHVQTLRKHSSKVSAAIRLTFYHAVKCNILKLKMVVDDQIAKNTYSICKRHGVV